MNNRIEKRIEAQHSSRAFREMSGKFKIFQGQGIVRELCDVSGKNEILQKCQGNVREFYISA